MNNSIDLRQFRYFIAVYEERNFGRAAKRLHISQPPLSRQIHQLEEHLGVELFSRTKYGVEPTIAGKRFLPEAKKAVVQAEKAIMVARSVPQNEIGKLIIDYTTVFDKSVIPDVVPQIQNNFPQWTIMTKANHSVHLVREIKKGTLDVAFIGTHTNTFGLESIEIYTEQMMVALPIHNPLARKRSIEFSDIQDENLFWFERQLNPGFYDYCHNFFNRISFHPQILPEPQDHHILLGLIAEGKGFALLPSSLKKIKRQGVTFRKIKTKSEILSIGISVVFLKENQSPALNLLINLLQEKKN